MAHIVKFIYTEDLRGNGSVEDPFRRIPQLFSDDGTLIASYDPHTGDQTFSGLNPLNAARNLAAWQGLNGNAD